MIRNLVEKWSRLSSEAEDGAPATAVGCRSRSWLLLNTKDATSWSCQYDIQGKREGGADVWAWGTVCWSPEVRAASGTFDWRHGPPTWHSGLKSSAHLEKLRCLEQGRADRHSLVPGAIARHLPVEAKGTASERRYIARKTVHALVGI